MKLSTWAKLRAGVRTAVRRTGYDIVPFQSSFHDLQGALLRDVTCVLDVGANTGQYHQLLGSLGYRGPVVSFEPGEQEFAVLARLSADDPTWTVRNVALGETPGSAVLNVAGNSVSSSLLTMQPEHLAAEPRSGVLRHEAVAVETLDQQIPSLPNTGPYWLKIDTQGYELAVLGGATQLLASVSAIQCELSFAGLYSGQADWLELCGTLREHGFDLVHVEPGFFDPRDGRLLQADGLFARPPAAGVA